MGTKTLIRLLIALAVIGGIAAILHYAGPGGGVSQVDSTTKKKKVFSNFPLNDVAQIVVEEKDASVTLKKGESSWEVVERDGYRADTEPIATLLKDIWDLNIGQLQTIGRSQYGRLHLVDPAAAENADEAATVLHFLDADGKELASLLLGKVFERAENRPSPVGGMATSDAGRYVKRGDSNSVYLVAETFSDVETDPSEWIDKSFFKITDIESIAIDRKNKQDDWKLERASAEEDYALVGIAEGEELDPMKVSSMRSAFSNPQIEDVYHGDEAKEAKTDVATFRIKTFDGFSYVISVGEKNDLNELPLTLIVSAEFDEKRTPGEEESDEEKERLDKEFTEELASLKERLAAEKALEGHTFKVRSYLVDSLLKNRSELLADKQEAEAGGEEVAPGVTLPGLPQAPIGPASAAPKGAPKASAPAAGKARSAPKAPKAGKEATKKAKQPASKAKEAAKQ